LTLVSPINFLHLQLQNNSALGVEINPAGYHALYASKFKKFKLQFSKTWEYHKVETLLYA